MAYEVVFKVNKVTVYRTLSPVPIDDYTVIETCTDSNIYVLGLTGIVLSLESKVVKDDLCGEKTFHALRPGMVTRWGCQRTDRVLKCRQPLGKFIKDASEAAQKRAQR
jgi:hypothetical protein